MDVVIGGIYEISKEWHPYDMSMFNHRPAIVIDIYNERAEIVLMGALQKASKRENHLMIDIEVNNTKYISVIACDVVHQIPLSYLTASIGYVKKEVIEKIWNKRGRKYICDEKATLQNKESQNSYIVDTKKFYEMISNIEENTKKSREISEKTQTSAYVWKERIIGFVFGIMASVIASFIWDIRVSIWNWINSILGK